MVRRPRGSKRIGYLDATDWHCETCGHSGRIKYVHGAGVYEVLHILEDAHRDASGGCTDLGKMRVTPADRQDGGR